MEKHSLRWAVTAGLLVGTICVASFAFAYSLPPVYRYGSDEAGTKKAELLKKREKQAECSVSKKAPLLKTGLDNLFFTADSDGNITFYSYSTSKHKFIKAPASGSLKVSLLSNGEKATLRISYIKKNGRTVGFGVFKNPDSLRFPYAFVKLSDSGSIENIGSGASNDSIGSKSKNVSKNSGKDSGRDFDYLLYVDYSIDDFYRNDKSYSALYTLDTKGGRLKRVFSENSAPVSEDEIIDPSFLLIPDSFTGTPSFYFLSSRSYERDSLYDLYGKSSLSSPDELLQEGLGAPLLFYKGSRLCFLKENEDSGGAALCCLDGEISALPGKACDYLYDSGFLFNPNRKFLYNIKKADGLELNTSITINGLFDFALSDDGKKLAVTDCAGLALPDGKSLSKASSRGLEAYPVRLIVADLQSGKANVIDSSLIMPGLSNLCFVNDSLLLTLPDEKHGDFSTLVFSWDTLLELR